MPPRIAIPLPLSRDPEYVERSLPQYERAVEMAGGEPVRIPLDKAPSEITKIIERCEGVLLPGSSADVEPAKYGASGRHPKTNAADPPRDAVDELLLRDAFRTHKPVLAICYGLQILNVYCRGTLVQHIESAVNHAAGRQVPVAHTVEIEPASKLAEIVFGGLARLGPGLAGSSQDPGNLGRSQDVHRHREAQHVSRYGGGHGFSRAAQAENQTALAAERRRLMPVNSSHHQSADVAGDSLRVVARCPEDGIVEALEGTAPDHFVLAVQWHPERSATDDEASQAIFRALVEAAAGFRPPAFGSRL